MFPKCFRPCFRPVSILEFNTIEISCLSVQTSKAKPKYHGGQGEIVQFTKVSIRPLMEPYFIFNNKL